MIDGRADVCPDVCTDDWVDDRVIVTLSVGQSKIGAGAIDYAGNLLCRLQEIVTPSDESARFSAIAQQVVAVIERVGLSHVAYVGISYPELMSPPRRMVANPNDLPDEANPFQEKISGLVATALGSPIQVELLHDAAAAALGEVSSQGTLPGCRDCLFIVWGTGVASGIISKGQLYWKDPLINMMTGEIGLQVIRQPDGSFVYRPTAQVPAVGPLEVRLDRWLRGPELARRFREHVRTDRRGKQLAELAGKTVADLDLVDINHAARRGDALAIALIEVAGREMGRALAPFVYYWLVERAMSFTETIIIGSGVAKLGDEVQRNGENILSTAIRKALGKELSARKVEHYDTTKVFLSVIGYEREYYAFVPNRHNG